MEQARIASLNIQDCREFLRAHGLECTTAGWVPSPGTHEADSGAIVYDSSAGKWHGVVFQAEARP